MKHTQPAKRSYLLHESFIDLNNVITHTFSNCREGIIESAQDIRYSFRLFKQANGIWSKVFFLFVCFVPFGYALTRLTFITIITPLICAMITIFQVSILLLLFLVAYIFVCIIIFSDWLFCLINSIGSHCPNCQEKFILPTYYCECGAEHSRLTPGAYGIFTRECNCGRLLATTFLNGRHKHEAHCPVCKYYIGDALQASVCIPVVGGAYSGKTCYISMTMLALERSAARYGLRYEYERNERDDYQQNVANLSRGKYPLKTQNYDYLTYYQFALTPPGTIKQTISLCDVAGELYDVKVGKKSILKQKGLRYANAFILIIDPLSITEYRKNAIKNLNITDYKGSTQPIEEVVDTLINSLQNIFHIKAMDIINTDVAVVFTKMDIPGLSDIIGEGAISRRMPNNDQRMRHYIQNQLCEEFLRKYSEHNFLQSFKARFRTIQFFTCSALGHPENGQPFQAHNVEEPLLWLLKNKSNVLARYIR